MELALPRRQLLGATRSTKNRADHGIYLRAFFIHLWLLALLLALGGKPLDSIGAEHQRKDKQEPILDFLILNGQVHQTSKQKFSPLHIGIRGETIVFVGQKSPRARSIIDAQGMVVAPGFIDTNIVGILAPKAQKTKLFDGVTTVLSGHGNAIDFLPMATRLNQAYTVGLDRNFLKDYPNQLQGLLIDAAQRGFYGACLSTEYIPREHSQAFVQEVCRASAKLSNFSVTFHTRYSDRTDEEKGVLEALECAESTGLHVHLLHLNSTGGTFRPQNTLSKITRAQQQGISISYDFYPFTVWKSAVGLGRFSGDWAEKYNLKDVPLAQRVWPEGGMAHDITLEKVNQWRTSDRSKKLYVDAIPQQTIDFFALETSAPIGSDSNIQEGHTHPRGASSFATFFKNYVASERVSLPKTLDRFSSDVANTFLHSLPGLRDRGEIAEGKKADIIIFDPKEFRPRSTYAHNTRPSIGMSYVMVNGTLQIRQGEVVEMAKPSGAILCGAGALSTCFGLNRE